MSLLQYGVAVAASCVIGAGCGGSDEPAAKPQTLELKQNRHGGVYMGVRCLEPNSVKCDRVGLAIWVKEPAESLVADIDGRELDLVSPGEFVPGKGTGWEGNLQPAGLRDPDGPLAVAPERGRPDDYWSGVDPVEVRIRLTATYEDGTTATRTVRAPLHPGWG